MIYTVVTKNKVKFIKQSQNSYMDHIIKRAQQSFVHKNTMFLPFLLTFPYFQHLSIQVHLHGTQLPPEKQFKQERILFFQQ